MLPATYGPAFPDVASDDEPGTEAVSFDALYREHFSFVWRSLRRLGVAQHALDDAAQEVFLVVHRRFTELHLDKTPKACLFAIAQRVASDQRRWLRRKGHPLPLHEDLPGQTSTPLENAIQREASDLVLDFLGQLDEPRRVAFVLSDLEQMTAPEIAQALAANLNTVYYRIASARRAFVAYVAARCPDTDLPEPRHG